MHDEVSNFLLDESYDYIFNMKEECLTFSLRKYLENCDIF